MFKKISYADNGIRLEEENVLAAPAYERLKRTPTTSCKSFFTISGFRVFLAQL